MRLYQTLARLSLMVVVGLAVGAAGAAAQVTQIPSAGSIPVKKPVVPPSGLRAMINVYGTVKDLDGRTVTGVLIEFFNADNNQRLSTALTDSVGTYNTMVGVAGNQKGYTVVPSARTYQFVPAKSAVTSAKRVDFTMQRTSSTNTK